MVKLALLVRLEAKHGRDTGTLKHPVTRQARNTIEKVYGNKITVPAHSALARLPHLREG